MRISQWVDRLWGDIAAQPVAVAILAAAITALAFLAAVGLVESARRAEAYVRARIDRSRWARSTAPGPQAGADEPQGARYPEDKPPGRARIRAGRRSRRRMWELIEATLQAESEDA